MVNTSSPSETSSEGSVLNDPATVRVVREAIDLSSGEEGDSSLPESNNSTSKSTHQHCQPQTTWSNEARHGLIQQVYHEKPYLMDHGQGGKAWENIASVLSTIPPFVDAGGITAEACRREYASMLKDHREKVAARRKWKRYRIEGEWETVHLLLSECMAEEQLMLEEREKKQSESEGREQEKEKEAGAEKPPEASVALAGNRSRVSRGRESREVSEEKPTGSSSSSYSSVESTMAGYLASLTDSPDTKRRRKGIEASDAATRRQDEENRRLERELRQQEMKENQAILQKARQLVARLLDKFS